MSSSNGLFLGGSLERLRTQGTTVETHETRHSLIRRACNPGDGEAWEDFVGRYRRFICYILHEIGVSKDDVDDLCQVILFSLTHSLASYDRSRVRFRSWLGAVIRNSAFTHLRTLKRRSIYLKRFGQEVVVENSGDAPGELDAIIENEWKTYVSSLAMDRVR